MTVLVTGGTGFVGGHVVAKLREHEHPIRALVRDPQKGAALAGRGCELVAGDVTDPQSLRAAVDGCDTVVHLVAIRRGRPADFERVMIQATRDLVAASREAGVSRFVLMSAAGTSKQTASTVPYFHAKWAMEETVRESGLEHVIFRPSFVFGRDGGVLPLFVRQVRYSPVTPVIGAGLNRVQPIWVDDVADFFAASIGRLDASNRIFELGGPDVVSWNELYERIAKVLGKRRRRLNIPSGLLRAGAGLTERIPGAPVTRDEIAMIEIGDNVIADSAAVETFELALVPLDEQIRRAA